MSLKVRSLLVALFMSSVILAGCTSDDGSDVDGDPADDGTKGTLSGLLVDDNFRPIQLKEEWSGEPGDYQDKGFILITETAERVETTENGEFEVTGLVPGTYTLRVSAEGHEAVQETVQIEAGETSSVTLEARRKVADLSTIITTEYAIFIACNAYATFDCTFDASGDTSRPGVFDNFTEYADEVTFATWEVLLNNPYIFCLEVRESSGTGASLDRHFGNWCEGEDSTYTKGILQNGEIYDEVPSQDAWDPTAETEGILFTFGNSEATCWAKPGDEGVGPNQVEAAGETVNNPTHNRDDRYRCAGVSLAVKAELVFSMFLYDVAVEDVEDYCILCE